MIFYRLTAILVTVSLFSYMLSDTYSVYAAKKKEIIVAIIDTGVNVEHEMLNKSIWINNTEIPGNGIDDDGNGYADDIYGWDFYNNDASVFHDISYENSVVGNDYEDDHGTHVAGLIITEAENAKKNMGDRGTADIKLMILKVNGGEEAGGTTKNAIKAIEYASKNGACICNLSWGSYDNDPALKSAIEKSEMLFVCCAGNDGSNNDEKPVFPASYDLPNILSVTGAELTNGVRLAGNYGRRSVDVCADSAERLSSVSHGMGFKSGASMATAAVTGVAAAVLSVKDLSADEVVELIVSSSEKIDEVTGITLRGGLCEAGRTMAGLSFDKQEKVEENATALLLSYNEITLETGKGVTLRYLVLPAGNDCNVTFTSSDEEVATISYNGLIMAKKKGDTTIIAKTESGVAGICLVHVYDN